MKSKNMQKMRSNCNRFGIDLPSLEAEARASESKEAYYEILKGNDYRFGVIVQISHLDNLVYSIELVVSIFSIPSKSQVRNLERISQFSKTLQDKGYAVSHLDDGWLLYEKAILRDILLGECEAVMGLLVDYNICIRESDKSETMDNTIKEE